MIVRTVQPIYLPAISQSDGSAWSTLRIRNAKLQRNSSSANKIEIVLRTQINTAPNHAKQLVPACFRANWLPLLMHSLSSGACQWALCMSMGYVCAKRNVPTVRS